jgi:hypothetical protein
MLDSDPDQMNTDPKHLMKIMENTRGGDLGKAKVVVLAFYLKIVKGTLCPHPPSSIKDFCSNVY